MIDMRDSHWRTCPEKRAYQTEKEARDRLRAIRDAKGKTVTKRLCVYQCSACGLWHIGRHTKTRRELGLN